MWARRRRTVPTRSVSRVVPTIQPNHVELATSSSTGPFDQPNVAGREINGLHPASERGFCRHLPGARRAGLEELSLGELAASTTRVDPIARWSADRSLQTAVPHLHPLRGTRL